MDVPDLRVLAELWPQVKDVWMGAGTAPAPLHRALNVFAWLVQIRLLSTLSWMASLMHFVTQHVRWGEHRGGMFVTVEGRETRNGVRVVVREWHLLAEGSDGPLISCMAIEVIVRKSLAGAVPPAGARQLRPPMSRSRITRRSSRGEPDTGCREEYPNLRPIHRCISACSARRGINSRRRSGSSTP